VLIAFFSFLLLLTALMGGGGGGGASLQGVLDTFRGIAPGFRKRGIQRSVLFVVTSVLKSAVVACLMSVDAVLETMDRYPDKRAPNEGFRAPRGVIEGVLQGVTGLVVESVAVWNRRGHGSSRSVRGALLGLVARPASGLAWTLRRISQSLLQVLGAKETMRNRVRAPRSFLREVKITPYEAWRAEGEEILVGLGISELWQGHFAMLDGGHLILTDVHLVVAPEGKRVRCLDRSGIIRLVELDNKLLVAWVLPNKAQPGHLFALPRFCFDRFEFSMKDDDQVTQLLSSFV